MPCQNWLMAAELGFWLSGCSPVLADQASGGVPALDPGSDIDGLAGFVQWRSLLPRLMGPVGIVMSRVPGQDAPEMLLAVDQHVIETLAAQRAHIPFAKEFARGDRTGALMTRVPLPAKT